MKIDALSISSDLLIAFRIEELNEKYGTEILLTGEVQALLSDKARDMLREIDQIIIKESQEQRSLYMFDIKPIEPLVQNEDEEDEKKGLMDEKP